MEEAAVRKDEENKKLMKTEDKENEVIKKNEKWREMNGRGSEKGRTEEDGGDDLTKL